MEILIVKPIYKKDNVMTDETEYKVLSDKKANKALKHLSTMKVRDFKQYLQAKPKIIACANNPRNFGVSKEAASMFPYGETELAQANELAQTIFVLSTTGTYVGVHKKKKRTDAPKTLPGKAVSLALQALFWTLTPFVIAGGVAMSKTARYCAGSIATDFSTRGASIGTYLALAMIGEGKREKGIDKTFITDTLNYLGCTHEDLGTGKVIEKAFEKSSEIIIDSVGVDKPQEFPFSLDYWKKTELAVKPTY